MMKKNPKKKWMWHAESADAALSTMGTPPRGLQESEASARLKRYGPNSLKEARRKTVLDVFLSQFRSLVVLILIGAALVSVYLGEMLDASIIAAIIMINAAIGTYHEYRAENEIAALKKLQASRCTVLRDGEEKEIDSAFVVPGDILLINTGDRISADARIIEAVRFKVDESTLTGESVPVGKTPDVQKGAKMIADMSNMVFSGTFATSGKARAVVVATGAQTEIGRIFSQIKGERELFPLQKKLNSFISILGKSTLLGAALLALLAIHFLGYTLDDILSLALAQTVSFIPEGLPIVVTIALAIGVAQMASKKALTRQLSAIEGIGAVSVICTDKTGTLTKNRMTVSSFSINSKNFSFKDGMLHEDSQVFDASQIPGFFQALRIGVLCNDASCSKEKSKGDPLEIAILEFASAFGATKSAAEESCPRIGEVPFEPKNKYMITMNRGAEGISYNLKGAVETVAGMCNRIVENGRISKLSASGSKKIIAEAERHAGKGLRLLAFAYKKDRSADAGLENGYIFAGMVAFSDPLREEARSAVSRAMDAGIKVIMITGDHKLTAEAIAHEAGIDPGKDGVITGYEMDELSDSQLDARMRHVSVCARMSTEHKLRIIESLKRLGHIVAMTGDGVNDALALKKADVGVSLGSGTEVAKEASDIIITDDNFSSIVDAVEEGRISSLNIRRVIKYLFATNFAELLVLVTILFSPLLFNTYLPLALLPIHILYVNLVTDGVCDVTLATERNERDVMKHKPSFYSGGLFTSDVRKFVVVTALIIFAGTLSFYLFMLHSHSLDHARTATFTLLCSFQLWSALNARTLRRSLFTVGLFSNRYLTAAIILSIMIQLAVIYLPEMNAVMRTTPLSPADWVAILLISSTIFFSFEILKFVERKGISVLS